MVRVVYRLDWPEPIVTDKGRCYPVMVNGVRWSVYYPDLPHARRVSEGDNPLIGAREPRSGDLVITRYGRFVVNPDGTARLLDRLDARGRRRMPRWLQRQYDEGCVHFGGRPDPCDRASASGHGPGSPTR